MIPDKVESIQIFGVPIFRVLLVGLSDELGLEKIVRDHVFQGKPPPAHPLVASGRPCVFQSTSSLHTEDEMQPFNKRIIEVMDEVLDQHGIDPSYEIDITSMWGNVQPQGHAFHRHSHHNNMFAGVYYVNEAENSNLTNTPIEISNMLKGFPNIIMWNDRRNNPLSPTRNYKHPFNHNSFPVELQKDLLVIFPAWLEHEVGENTSTRDRISISFNIILRGRYGEVQSNESVII